jgi:hypothetical protein
MLHWRYHFAHGIKAAFDDEPWFVMWSIHLFVDEETIGEWEPEAAVVL